MGFRDPIANDPSVVDDTQPVPVSGPPGSSAVPVSAASPAVVSGALLPIAVIAGAWLLYRMIS